mgnify:CR=1 FL=1
MTSLHLRITLFIFYRIFFLHKNGSHVRSVKGNNLPFIFHTESRCMLNILTKINFYISHYQLCFFQYLQYSHISPTGYHPQNPICVRAHHT